MHWVAPTERDEANHALARFSHRPPEFPIGRRGVGRRAWLSAVGGFAGRMGIFQR